MRLKFFFSYSLLVLSEIFKLLVLLLLLVTAVAGVVLFVLMIEEVEVIAELMFDDWFVDVVDFEGSSRRFLE